MITKKTEQNSLFDSGENAAETRASAYRAAKSKLAGRKLLVANYVLQCGELGATRDEVAAGVGLPIQSVCSVVLALLRDDRLIETKHRRQTRSGGMAVVLVAAGSPTNG